MGNGTAMANRDAAAELLNKVRRNDIFLAHQDPLHYGGRNPVRLHQHQSGAGACEYDGSHGSGICSGAVFSG